MTEAERTEPTRGPNRALTTGLGVATVAALALVGAVLAWPTWWIAAFAATTTLVALLCGRALKPATTPAGTTIRSQWRVHYTVAASALTASAVGLTLIITAWTLPDTRRPADTEAVTTIAFRVAESLATIDENNLARYLTDVKPYVTEQVIQALKEKIFDRLPVRPSPQHATVRAISIEALINDEASVVAIVDRHNPTPNNPEPTDTETIELWLVLNKNDNDQWHVTNIGLIA